MQIKQLADELEVNVSAIKRFLREGGFVRADRTFKGAEVGLEPAEERALREAHATGELSRNRGAIRDIEAAESEPDPEISSADLVGLRMVEVSRAPDAPPGDVAYPVYVHQDLLQWSEDPATPVELRKVYTRRLQELMAHGRASRSKWTHGKNTGWLRTPLGGNGGSHFYLWLCNHGERIREQPDASRALHDRTERGARFLRIVRHHDATRDVLDVGALEDYLPYRPNCVATAECDGLVDPLVPSQRAVVHDGSPVRIIVGRPGAGKTTSLQAAAARLSGRALYVTWSSTLAERAREWFRAYAPSTLDVEVMTFRAFLARVDPARPFTRELSLPEAVGDLRSIAEPLITKGPWRQRGELRADELYAELHAYLVGRALPVAFDGRRASFSASMGESDYRVTRQALGPEALGDALRTLRKLDADDLRRLFSAPVEAYERARALQDGTLQLDTDFAFDWILVDEVQDLTLSEQWLLIDVAARSGRARGVVPGLIFAGDEAQTVRPTGFEFAPLRKLIHQRLGKQVPHTEHPLNENLRSPETVAQVVEAADAALYGLLPRRERPRGQRSETPGDVTVGRVAEVDIRDHHDTRRVFEVFKTHAGDAALVYPGSIAPDNLASIARDVGITLWTSETIKGLEFRCVGVLAVPETVQRTAELSASTKHTALAIELARSNVDHLLVALSRSTETLVLCGSSWAHPCAPLSAIRAVSAKAGGDEHRDGFLGRVGIDDLDALLDLDAADSLPRIDVLLESSARFLEVGQFEDARREAENARGLLGTSGRPGAAGKHVRQRAHRQYAIALVATGLNSHRSDDLREASRAFHAAEEKEAGAFVTALAGSLHRGVEDTETCERLREVATDLNTFMQAYPVIGVLVADRVKTHVDGIIEAGTAPKQASGRTALVQALDALSSTAPTARDFYRTAHQRILAVALNAILTKTDKPHRAEFATWRTFLVDPSEGTVLDARHAEANGEFDSARILWEKANRPADALRCARALRDFFESARLAASLLHDDAETIAWARDLATLMRARPPHGRLADSECDVLTALARTAWMSKTPAVARTKGGARHA